MLNSLPLRLMLDILHKIKQEIRHDMQQKIGPKTGQEKSGKKSN